MSDMVNHPPHYTAGNIEVIEVIEDAKLGYHLGAAVKYILRSHLKGKQKEDLQKAVWYLLRYIDQLPDDLIEHNGMLFDPDTGNAVATFSDFVCPSCNKATDVVDSNWLCAGCHEEEPHGLANIDSKGSVTPPKPFDPPAKVIPHNIPKDVLEAHTERQNREMDRREEYREEYRKQYRKLGLKSIDSEVMEQLTIYD